MDNLRLGEPSVDSVACHDVCITYTMPARNTLQDDSDDDENYHESSDEDFNPAADAADASSSEDGEDDVPDAPVLNTSTRKRKRKALSPAELDSGDEKTIEAAQKKRARKNKGNAATEDGDILFSEDEAGEGGLIKTRAQRRVEYVARSLLYTIALY
jgi:hypothetical protein